MEAHDPAITKGIAGQGFPLRTDPGGRDVFHLQTVYRNVRERLTMVTIFLPGGTSAAARERGLLLGVLRRADYATSDLLASESGEHHEEVLLIRRLKDATIPSPGYPVSRRRKLNPDQKALASWENEGGAVRAANRSSFK